MNKIASQITTSLDGYITGPDDGPGQGLGVGGERLHYWVFGGPWSYDEEPRGEADPVDKELLDSAMAEVGAAICGRGMFEGAGMWGGENPFGVPLYVVTHRPDDVPDVKGFTFVDGFDDALAEAKTAAGEKTVAISGGADVIRQGLQGEHIEELTVSIAPVVLGGGKHLFEGLEKTFDLEQTDVVQSPWVTHLSYRVRY